jgi:hypothetical protein
MMLDLYGFVTYVIAILKVSELTTCLLLLIHNFLRLRFFLYL